MNKYIIDQLNNCKFANIPEFSSEDTVLIIDGIRRKVDFLKGHIYSIELENYMVNPPPNFDIFINWNASTSPSTCRMELAEVVETVGDKMIKISGNCDDGKFWSGWIPKKSIKSAKEIKK